MVFDRVKIFGERNTGTNALAQAIQLNSASECLPGTEEQIDVKAWDWARSRWIVGRRRRERLFDKIFDGQDALHAWKHCATNFDDVTCFGGALVLFLVRHPASWVQSLHRNPYQAQRRPPKSLSNFLDFSWQTSQRELLSCQNFTPLQLFNEKIRSYHNMSRKLDSIGAKYCFIKFEDIVVSQRNLLEGLISQLTHPADVVDEVFNSTKEPSKSLDYYREYYGEERWRAEIAGLEDKINCSVDWQLLEPLGYKRLSSAV